MSNDYKNFVERMGSFEDEIDLSDNIQHSNIVVTKNRNEELSHHGILGMHWGHHKAINPQTIGKAAKVGQDLATLGQNVNKGGFNSKSIKDAKSLSDEELKKLTARLNLENNYINAKQQQSGRGHVDNILSIAGSTLAVATSAAVLYETISKLKG